MSSYARVRTFLYATFIFVSQFFMIAVSADDTEDYFQKGVAASKQGEYSEAVLLFEHARASGAVSPALHYNLGVAYYRTGDLAKARTAFGALVGDSQFASLAYYNLGLIALKQDDFAVAKQHFTACLQGTSDEKLKALSRAALDRTSNAGADKAKLTGKRSSPWHGIVLLSFTHDNNVQLEDANIATATEKSGNYFTSLATIGGIFYGTNNNGIRLDAFAYDKSYQKEVDSTVAYDSSDFDISQFQVGVSKLNKLSRWENRYGLAYNKIFYGGKDYLDQVSVNFSGKRYIDKRKYVRVNYSYADISAAENPNGPDPDYSYLSGWHQKADIDVVVPAGKHKYRLGFILELDDRDDLGETGVAGFRSYSATRETLRARYYYQMTSQWKATLDTQYRLSVYNDADVRTDLTTYTREDNRRRFTVGLDYKLAPQWACSVSYSNTNNHSNRVPSYSQSLLGAQINWVY